VGTRALWAVWLVGCVTDAEVERVLDRDGDGFRSAAAGGTDCDDGDPRIHPGAPEVCGDGVDNDCDGAVDDFGQGAVTWFRDEDGDGVGNVDVTRPACPGWTAGLAEGWSTEPGDCDDADPARYGGAFEACDGIDNDCDAEIDEGPGIASTSGQRFEEIDEAFVAASSGDGVVRVCAGTHAVSRSLDVPSGASVALQGAGAARTTLEGGAVAVQDAALRISDVTLIGPSGGPAIRARGGTTLVIADVVVRDCDIGVDISGPVDATITDTDFVDIGGGAAEHRGLVASGPFTLDVVGGRFERILGGSAIELGGGTKARFTLTDTVFRDNEGGLGGALHLALPGSFALQDVQLVGNRAASGGALYVQGNLALRGVTVTDNRADEGAGLYVAGGSVTVDGASVFERNVADDRSGAAHVAAGTLVVEGADFGVGLDDNLPEDIESDDGVEQAVLGTVTNTVCTPSGCSP